MAASDPSCPSQDCELKPDHNEAVSTLAVGYLTLARYAANLSGTEIVRAFFRILVGASRVESTESEQAAPPEVPVAQQIPEFGGSDRSHNHRSGRMSIKLRQPTATDVCRVREALGTSGAQSKENFRALGRCRRRVIRSDMLVVWSGSLCIGSVG